jgi:hypothetical protein
MPALISPKTQKTKHSFLYLFLITLSALIFLIISSSLLATPIQALLKGISNTSVFNCDANQQNVHENFDKYTRTISCLSDYYTGLTSSLGVRVAIDDAIKRAQTNVFAKIECHQIMHAIGRTAGKNASSIENAFALGDSYCHEGYYHGAVEGFISKEGATVNKDYLNNLCRAYRKPGTLITTDQYNCAHGIGHGLMRVSQNQLLETLKYCDLLSDRKERQPCWNGAFMENTIAYMRGVNAPYLNPADPLYPCDLVEPKYKDTCYGFQISFYTKKTGSLEKAINVCEKIPIPFQRSCFLGLGREVVTAADADITKINNNTCLLAKDNINQENCIIGAVRTLIHYHHSDIESQKFCSVVPKDFQETCLSASDRFFYLHKISHLGH